jgi:hypothetical protein
VAPRLYQVDDLVRRYEAVRGRDGSATGEDGRGRALMMHQGVAAWIDAWATCQAAPRAALEAPPSSRAGLKGRPSAADGLPVGVLSQMARVLTTMVVGHLHDRRA